MTDLVDQMFPPIHKKWESDFTDFNYWKTPVQEFPLPDLTPPSPALSARSDTSTQSALTRLRNFSIGGRQSVSINGAFSPRGGSGTPAEIGVGTGGPGERSMHLRQMSSFERLSSRLASLAVSSSPTTVIGSGSGSFESRSSSSTFLDSDEDADIQADLEGGVFKPRRRRSTSVASMPGSLDDDDLHFGMDEEEGEEGEGHEGDGEDDGGEYEEEAAEEAFDEDFLATGEMKNVPFL